MFDEKSIKQNCIDEISEWLIIHGVALKTKEGTARHCPYSIAPITMEQSMFDKIIQVTPLISKLIHAVSEDHKFLRTEVASAAKADEFFGRLLELHKEIHEEKGISAARFPLLMMRTDFMDGRETGAKVVEFNGIAAGMQPFGQRAHELHCYIKDQWPEMYKNWASVENGRLAENQGLIHLAKAVAETAIQVRQRSGEHGKPCFIMVVHENEDNVYDQHLLEVAIQKHGIKTFRRTFKQLHSQLSTGDNERLILEGIGGIDVVYLRAGYSHCDYYIPKETNCCYTLSATRAFLEKHKVAINATVSQQLATSKTMQMILTAMDPKAFTRWGISEQEAVDIQSVLAEMKPINEDTKQWFKENANPENWVLKNQGEGGGHCVFGKDILNKLSELKASENDAWALMWRLFPRERERPALTVRDNKVSIIHNLICEVGLFTVHFEGKPMTEQNGYAGYLIRSKPATEGEGGVHSGKGVIDSIALIN
eukprot:Pgem_evm1s15921